MQKTFKRILAIMLVVVMTIGIAPLSGFVGLDLPEFGGLQKLADSVSEFFEGLGTKAEAATSGTCGDNLTWNFDESTDTLTITGSGEMLVWDYSSVPWRNICSKIKSVIISDGVINIGDYAFYDCSELTNISIPNSIISIGNFALGDCNNLTTVVLPISVTRIGKYAFDGCTNLEHINIPPKISCIEEQTFSSCSRLVDIVIPNNVKSIGDSAFRGCSWLTNIEIPDGVTAIGSGAFGGCNNIEKILIPNSVKELGNWVFESCDRLTEVIIGKNVVNIGLGVFRDCSSLEIVELNCEIESIENETFKNCGMLSEIKIPDSVLYIHADSFYGCQSIKNISIPPSVVYIGSYAFSGCNGLTKINIPENVVCIDVCAFSFCENLVSVEISKSVKEIGDCPFKGCPKLVNMHVNVENMYFSSDEQGLLFNKNKTILIQYPNGRQDNLFVIPNTVSTLGSYAFYNENFTDIYIPCSVTRIGNGAFFNCQNLKNVYYAGTDVQWKNIEFGYSNESLHTANIYLNQWELFPEEPDDGEKYKNATISLDQNSYTVKEPDLLIIEGVICCPDGVEDLTVNVKYNIEDFFMFSSPDYEIISETEKRFTAYIAVKNPGEFKISVWLSDDSKSAECTVISYKDAVSAFISEHSQFVKSDKYQDFVEEKSAQKLAEGVRNAPLFYYHWNNFISMNFFENYYDLVLAELLTNDTSKQSVKEELEKLFSSEFVDLTNKIYKFINTSFQDSLEPISEADFYLVFNADKPKVYEDTAIYKALTDSLEDSDKKLFNNVFEVNELFGYANKIADMKECAVEGLVDCVYYFAAINAYRKAGEEIKNVIKKAATKTDNSGMKEALESYAQIDSEDDYLGFAESLFEKFVDVGGKTAIKICFNSFDFEMTLKFVLNITLKDGTKLADKVVRVVSKKGVTVGTIAQYANATFAGVSLGMAVSELITNADDYSLYASKCTHAGDLSEAFLEVLNEAAADFMENKTLENAHFFDVAFNFYKDIQVYALTAATESVYAQNSSVVAIVINKAKSVSSYLSKINRYENLHCHKHDLNELINAEYYFVDEKYAGSKVLKIACPVDVYVYDSLGNLAVSVENDFVEIFDNRLDAFVLNSEKYICVPLDEEFSIKITSTDKGKMDYSVFEFDENSELIREVSKENISLEKDKKFKGNIDNLLNTDTSNYSLIVEGTHEVIVPEKDVVCVSATDISISHSSLDLTVGQGETINATLYPSNSTDNLAWISSDDNVVTVSENGAIKATGKGKAYIIAMVSDLIYACCEINVTELKEYTVTWIVDGEETVYTYEPGEIIVIPNAPVKEGYVFAGWTPAVPDVMPDYDLTFTAVFEECKPSFSAICPDCGLKFSNESEYAKHISTHSKPAKITITGGKITNGELIPGATITIIAEQVNGKIFSHWVIEGATVTDTNSSETTVILGSGEITITAEYDDCECKCHQGGLVGFFYKIILFFQKLFGNNLVCFCGAKH